MTITTSLTWLNQSLANQPENETIRSVVRDNAGLVVKDFRRIRETLDSQAINIDRKIAIFKKNPNHPSLRLHKLSGLKERWSISVDMGLRIIFEHIKIDEVYFIDIGSHDEVY